MKLGAAFGHRTAVLNWAVASRGLAITGRASKNVAAKKNKQDALKSKLFTRLGVKILMAVRNGGNPDPSKNADLSRVLKEAAQVKLPKENIDRALKKATEKNTEDFTSGIYEVYGHGSAAILVQTLTDNPTRAVKTIKEKVSRSVGAKFTSGGSVLFNFTQKAVLRPAAPYDADVVLELGISSNVEDVEFLEAEQPPAIVTDAAALSRLQDALLEAGIDARGELEYLANDRISLSDADREKNEKLIESLEELDDVDSIYHNIDGDI